jgi:hypothetical protein
MPGSEEFIQTAVHALEAGGFAVWVIVKGEYKDWATVIQRNQILEQFPLKWNTVALGLENECIFLSDHDREHKPAPPTQ